MTYILWLALSITLAAFIYWWIIPYLQDWWLMWYSARVIRKIKKDHPNDPELQEDLERVAKLMDAYRKNNKL